MPDATPPTAAELDEWGRLCREATATPGPWGRYRDNAIAREALPRLLAEVARLREELAKWMSDPQYQYAGPGPINRAAIECRNEEIHVLRAENARLREDYGKLFGVATAYVVAREEGSPVAGEAWRDLWATLSYLEGRVPPDGYSWPNCYRKLQDDRDALLAENARLRKQSLTCAFCGTEFADFKGLRDHCGACEPHPLAKENARLRADLAAEREACAKVAEVQMFYPDTHTGTRQQWVKDQIAAAIRARGEARDGGEKGGAGA